MKKAARLQKVAEFVKRSGKALAKDVAFHLADLLEKEKDDPAFVRSIYRDLNELVDENILRIQYISMDGEDLDPAVAEEGGVKYNTYFMPPANEMIPGYERLKKLGVKIVVPKDSSFQMAVIDPSVSCQKGHLYFLLPPVLGDFSAIEIPADQMPFSILLGRRSSSVFENDFMESLYKNHGRRAMALILNERSVSRIALEEPMGHVLLTCSDMKITMEINPRSGGVSCSELSEEDYSFLERGDGTTEHALFVQRDFEKVEGESGEVKIPMSFKFGNLKATLYSGDLIPEKK